MNQAGEWSLSPAYDLTYAYNPKGAWTHDHQMSLAGRRNDFERDDLLQFAHAIGIKTRRAKGILNQVGAAVSDWPQFAQTAGVATRDMVRIQKTFRSNLMLTH